MPSKKQDGGNYSKQFQFPLSPCYQNPDIPQKGFHSGGSLNIPTPYDLGVNICPNCGGMRRDVAPKKNNKKVNKKDNKKKN